jgi:hypothetical protein
MKPRILNTYKILAVALTATAGCATTTGAGPEPARSESPVAVVVPVSAPAQTESPQAAPSSPAPAMQAPAAEEAAAAKMTEESRPRPESQDPKLLALRSELASLEKGKIFSNVARFRPLCDKDGYPLVGNLARKGGPVGSDPSEFCAQVRTKGGEH